MSDSGVANREKGEVEIDVGGKTYVLVMDFEAMCQLEDKLSTADKDVTFVEVMQKADRGSMRHMRAVLWAALLRHQPDITLQDVTNVIQTLGGVNGLNKALLAVSKATRPDAEDLPKGKRPQRAQVNGATTGTGAISTSKPVELA